MALNDDIIMSEEDTSNDEEQISDKALELESSEDESVAGEDDENLDASATESDEDESELENEIEEKKSKSEKVKESIYQRYQERQGKQLFIRFPHKIPETQEALEQKVKEIAPLAIKAHKPRQRHVRFCLIDFATNEDRDAALNTLRKSIKKGDLKKFAVDVPRTENMDFVQELADRKIKSLENKKAKLRLKRASKKALKENNFTSTVVVLNLPKNASIIQVRELFINAVDINIKPGKGKITKDTSIAAVTFPTTHDARNAIKKKLSLGGNPLVIKFDNKKFLRKSKSKNAPRNNEKGKTSESPTKLPKLDTLGKKTTKATDRKLKSKNFPKADGESKNSGSAGKRLQLEPTLKYAKTNISTNFPTQKPKSTNVRKNNKIQPATKQNKLEQVFENTKRKMPTNVFSQKPKSNKNKFKNNAVKTKANVNTM